MDALLDTLLTAPLARDEIPSGEAWRARLDDLTRDLSSPIDRAFVGGLHADRLGYAFAAGYQAALHALAPDLAGARITASFCATEQGGVHPRAIATRLEARDTHFVVTGEKSFSTMASDANVLFVVTTRGTRADGTNDLAMVRVSARAPGVRIENLPTPPFVPEITHARVTFDQVSVAPGDVLPGDGYARYLKPFRTIEDLHVHAALVGHFVRLARQYGWPHESIERALVLVAAVRGLRDARVDAAGTHLALAGVLGATRRWLDESEPHWALVDPVVRGRWQRDLPLLGVAGSARARRTDRAWESVLERAASRGAT